MLKIKSEYKPNERQQQCIDNIEGKIMVLAGPGTGKTFTIIQRIASMLMKNINPESILCLTFSDAAASEMKKRLSEKIGLLSSSVNIYTYHSFCNEVIKLYPDNFGISDDVSLITPALKRELMVEAIDEADLKFFVSERAGKYFYINTFINCSEKIKTLRINKEKYLEYINTNPLLMPQINKLQAEIEEKTKKGDNRITTRIKDIAKIEENIKKAQELWKVYEIYQRKMIENNFIDFSDMISLVIDKFESDNLFLKEISNKYKYFLVDEYQDTNNLQNKILFNLIDANEYKNVFAVGDDDQIIYGFQGANSENVDNFLKYYPDTKVICLIENNRSTQSVLDLSYRIVTQDSTRLENNPLFQSYNIEKKLIAVNENVIKQERKIKRWQFGELIQEYNYIVEDIEKLINSDNCPVDKKTKEKKLSEIAVIATKNSELKEFENRLKAKGIPCQMNDGEDIFKIRSVLAVYFYIKALNNRVEDSDKLFGLLLTEPFCINLNDYNKLFKEYKRLCVENNDFIANMKKLSGWSDKDKIDEFVNTFEYLQEFAASNNLRNTIIEIINRTKILEFFYSASTNKTENILGLKKIMDEAADCMRLNKSASLNDFVTKLDYAHLNNIKIEIDKNNVIQNALQLVTYHGSKGREFEYVYLPNLVSQNWEKYINPGEYKMITEKVLDKDEAQIKKDSELLKKLFVGITRAKYGLVLSHSDNVDRKPRAVTKYLNVVSDFDFDKKTFEYKDDDLSSEIFKSLSTEAQNHRKAFEFEIQERVKNIILSHTSINCYLKCPKQFFYNYVMKIEVAQTDWDAANFGNIIHKILEKSAKTVIHTDKYISKEEAAEIFEKEMNYTVFKSKEEKGKYYSRGLKFIDNYYRHFCEVPAKIIAGVEENFDGIPVVDDKFIKGKIDRIENAADNTFALYDYKTSRASSEIHITKGGQREDYYNQLCFYKYAYEKKYPEREVSKAGIIYVEDNKTSEISLTKQDMEYIENLIISVYENINNLKFSSKCENDENTCKYCPYKDLCRLDVI